VLYLAGYAALRGCREAVAVSRADPWRARLDAAAAASAARLGAARVAAARLMECLDGLLHGEICEDA